MKGVSRMLAAALVAMAGACSPSGSGSGGYASSGVEQDISASRNAGPTSATPGAPLADRSRDLRTLAKPAPSEPPAPPSAPATSTAVATGAFAPAEIAPGNGDKGRAFALDNCRPCHVVAPDQSSPVRFANAPDFHAIANAAGTTPAGLNVWLTNPHPSMPTLRLTPAESADVIAYIMSLRARH